MHTKTSTQDCAIAVVGASALYPGSVGSASFWNNILSGQDFISEVPPDHWLVEDYYDPDPQAPGKVYANRGGFLPAVDFDPMQHGLPPRQLGTTDTAQLLGLVVAQKLLDDAASVQFGKVDKKNISVILGVASATELVGQMAARIQRPHWVKAMREAGLPESEVQDLCSRIEATYPEWDESTFPGLLGNVVAGRIANRLNLGGTNCVVDAACASSLGAVAMAVQELRLGHSDLVITGGVDALNDIFMFMCFSKTPALSPTGDCRPFSEDADGTMLGEGLGMLALRRLEDAERDGDKIYAVIRGIGSASDGRAKSIYAPRAEGQELAIRRAYEHAGYGPGDVGLIEAHGTATKAGDLAEFSGLTRAFSDAGRADRQWCALGSIKSQIGHTKSAAGAASLFKAVMALHHKVLPPTIKVSQPNTRLEIESTPFYLNTEARPWIHALDQTRKASVSSFGFGGSNFHVTLEEYVGDKSSALPYANLPVQLLLAGGADAASMLASLQSLRAALVVQPLVGLARQSQTGFDAQAPRRLALLARDTHGALADIDHAIATISKSAEQPFALANRMHYACGSARPKLAFLFPGQGSQYVGMGGALAMGFQAARRTWDELATAPLAGARKLQDVVFPIPVFSDAARQEQSAQLTRTEWAQPAIGVASLSMLRLLEQLNVRPDAVAGHSFGEVTALHAAGVLAAPQDMLQVARKRGELMAQAARLPGAMLAVRLAVAEVEQLIVRHQAAGICIANVNGPSQVVVAGATEVIERFQAALESDQIHVTRLPVATAFHTELVAGSAMPFGEFLAELPFGAARIPVYGNTAAAPYPGGAAEMKAVLAQQLAKPVQFQRMVERMHDDGYRLFVEVGPGSALTGMVGDCLKGREHVAVAFDSRKLDGRAAFLNVLAVLSSQGVAVDYAALWREFAEFETPQDAKSLSPATVKLSGANYGKPYPSASGAAGVPKPNPERTVTPPPAPQPIPAAAVPVSAAAFVPEAPLTAAPAAAIHQAPVHAASLNAEWAAAFQSLQQQTLEAQKNFTQTLADSHQAFLHASEVAFMQLGQMGGGSGAPYAAPMAIPVAAPVPVFTAAAVPASAAPPILPAQALQAAPVAVPAVSAPSQQAVAAPAAINYEQLLLEVVADKTGYPPSMLTLDMELEAGLGIDSIKRVEILAALQEKIPQLAGVDTGRLAALNTLGEILSFACAAAPATAATATVAVSAAVPATAAPAPVLDHQALLLQVVADKTGYPPAMLTLDMELEAGLGIDSIKRVEILAALQEKIPELAGADTSRMAALNTLGEILAFASGPAGNPVPATGMPPAQAAQAELKRMAVRLAATPATGIATPRLLQAAPLYLVGSGGGVSALLAARLADAGIASRVVDMAPADARSVILMGGLHEPAQDAAAQAALNQIVFQNLQACAESLSTQGELLVTVQDTGGGFGVDGQSGAGAWSAGIAALAKTAALEWPHVCVKAIDIERSGRSIEAVADALAAELLAGGAQLEVGLKSSAERSAPVLYAEAGIPGTAGAMPDDGVIVVAGGARGVTAACLDELIARAPGINIAILGRTELRDEPAEASELSGLTTDAQLKQALLLRAQAGGLSLAPQQLGPMAREVLAQRELRTNLERFRARGATVRYYAIDVTDAGAVKDTLAAIRSGFGPLRGLVHAAGVLADKEIKRKTVQQFRQVFQTKADGFRHLLDAMRDDALSHIVCFSSVAAWRGNVGQADYAMANEVLNRVCAAERMRRGSTCLVKSIGWGPWAGGMVDANLERHFAAMGVSLIPLADGARLFADEYTGRNGDATAILFGGGLEQFAASRPRHDTATFDVRFHRSTHPAIASHIIRDSAVVPMVMINDLALSATQAMYPEQHVVASADLHVIKGIQLRHFDGAGDRYRFECRRSAADAVAVRVCDEAGALYYTLKVLLGARHDGDAMGQQRLPALPPWQPASGKIYDGRLFHGPDLQVIQSLEGMGPEGCAGILQACCAQVLGGATPIDILDGGLQLAVLWLHEQAGCESLPTEVGRYTSHERWVRGEPVHCEAVCVSRTALMAQWTLTFRNGAGQLLASMEGVKIHLLLPAQPQGRTEVQPSFGVA